MKTIEETRAHLIEITDSPLYFKDHPEQTGVLLSMSPFREDKSMSVHEVERAHNAFMEMAEYMYCWMTDSLNSHSFDPLREAVREEMVGLLEYHTQDLPDKDGEVRTRAIFQTHIDNV